MSTGRNLGGRQWDAGDTGYAGGLLALFVASMLAAWPASAQENPPPEADETPAKTTRPRLLAPVQPEYPPNAWDEDVEGDVVLFLWVSPEGRVEQAEVVSTPGYGFEVAAIVAAKKMVFVPATIDGEPVRVKIRYTFRFRKPEKGALAKPPERPPEGYVKADTRPKGKLVGTVVERGTGRPMKKVEVYVLDLDTAVLTDDEGRFESAPLTPGGYAVTIKIPGYFPFETLERVGPAETLTVRYFVEPDRRAKYRTVVWGSEGKAMVGRTSLADAEIYEVPGTLGDPIRVVMLLPGVTSGATGIGYPVVRGALPGDTRYEVDGIQVPMLYHLVFGNAVVNPRFTTSITFQPGGYSVEHGQFPGALILAEGTGRADEPLTTADISILHGSLAHARPFGDEWAGLAAARYGTLGLIIEGIASNVVFRYWDYQTKAHWTPTEDDTLEIIGFGASNTFGEERPDGSESVLELGFHRLATRYTHKLAAGWWSVTAEGGYEFFQPPDEETVDETDPMVDVDNPDDTLVADYSYVGLRNRFAHALVKDLELRLGAEGELQKFGFDVPDEDVTTPNNGVTLGAYTELEWSPGDFTFMPGVRVDHYRYGLNGGPRQTSADPRVAVGYDVTDDVSVKASAGVHHGPPRVTIVEGPVVIGPVPGFVGVGLEHGLSRSIQFATGVETRFPWRFELALTGYYNLLYAPLDFSLLGAPSVGECFEGCDNTAEDDTPPSAEGRSFGGELLLRRRLGDSVFGWITYSLSRSERDLPGFGTVPFAFDQTHVINAVLSWDVGRHWTLGSTFHFHTGRPYTPFSASNCDPFLPDFEDEIASCFGKPFSERLPSFWRLDFRVQKRELFETWYFDFYIDVINVTFNMETVGYEVDSTGEQQANKILIFIPMIGLKGQF